MERSDPQRDVMVGVPVPDPGFTLAANHRFILDFAKRRGDIYDVAEYGKYIKAKMPEGKDRDRAILWNTITVRKLCDAGYLISEGQEKYRLNPLISEAAPGRHFSIGENHKKLLRQNTGGLLKLSDVKAAYKGKPEKERNRQNKMIDGMVRNLVMQGFLKNEGRGLYRLTETAMDAIATQSPVKDNRKVNEQNDIKITAFDRYLIEVSDNGQIDKVKLLAHDKAESLIKRIHTLENAGLIRNGRLTSQLLEQIGVAAARSKDRSLSMEKLTERQRRTLLDMRIFLNLSFEQISRHIYLGDRDAAKVDIRYMTDNDLLVKDREWNVYALGKCGVRLTNSYDPDLVRYTSKLFSRREEVAHDMRVYSAYKSFEAELRLKGMEVISVKNDRQMRSEDAKRDGYMTGSYPDLRIEYRNPITNKVYVHDIEIDCGYNERTVTNKLIGLLSGATGSRSRTSVGGGEKIYTGVSWAATGARQALKVARIATENKSKKLYRTKYLILYSMDEKLNMHKVIWW